MAMNDIQSTEARPFGAFAPQGLVAQIINWTRGAPDSYLGRKFAYALRRIGLSSLAGQPVDIEALGVQMRLHPDGNVCEKRVLFTPQYFDPYERELLT
ncbi:hypothetical protein AB4156_41560, partial [Cupriavidus sp. 2MCAB6]